jgi:hypothetical protein
VLRVVEDVLSDYAELLEDPKRPATFCVRPASS